jgi:hypothetical protein
MDAVQCTWCSVHPVPAGTTQYPSIRPCSGIIRQMPSRSKLQSFPGPGPRHHIKITFRGFVSTSQHETPRAGAGFPCCTKSAIVRVMTYCCSYGFSQGFRKLGIGPLLKQEASNQASHVPSKPGRATIVTPCSLTTRQQITLAVTACSRLEDYWRSRVE